MLCIPKNSLRLLLTKEAHEGGLIGHFGASKTLEVLKEYFYWPHMRQTVSTICEKCVVCKRVKSKVSLHGCIHLFPT